MLSARINVLFHNMNTIISRAIASHLDKDAFKAWETEFIDALKDDYESHGNVLWDEDVQLITQQLVPLRRLAVSLDTQAKYHERALVAEAIGAISEKIDFIKENQLTQKLSSVEHVEAHREGDNLCISYVGTANSSGWTNVYLHPTKQADGIYEFVLVGEKPRGDMDAITQAYSGEYRENVGVHDIHMVRVSAQDGVVVDVEVTSLRSRLSPK